MTKEFKVYSFFKTFLQRMVIAFIIAILCRFVFYVYNLDNFVGNPLNAFFQGLRFDAVSITYCFVPMILLSILPLPWRRTRVYQMIISIFYYIGILLTILPNLYDTISYHFTLKRSTADVLQFALTGDEAKDVVPDFIRENWILVFVLIGLILLTNFLYKKTKVVYNAIELTFKGFLIQFGFFLLGLGFIVLGARGGMELKPINIIDSSRYVKPNFVPVLLNSPFTILKTIFQESIKPKHYFSEKEVDEIYRPYVAIEGQDTVGTKNVVVIILESFAKEYVGYFNPERNFTPFMDSLMEESLVFTDAYANGQQSMDAVPAIFASLPDLMTRPFILSSYSNNKVPGLPTALRNNGYQTSFFHGGKNGTMGFDGFMKTVGSEKYFGLNEYPKDRVLKDNDGKWGIYDGPYFEYFSNEMDKMQEPFFTSVFSLSSHFPFSLPEGHENKYPKGEHPIMELVAYTDDALGKFFEVSKNKPWFNNTLFVITADHTAQPIKNYYKSKIGKYSIPLFVYSPQGEYKGEDPTIVSHVDIMPSILDHLNIEGEYFSMGKSFFNPNSDYAIQLERGQYQFTTKDYVILFNGEEITLIYKRTSLERINEVKLDNLNKQEQETVRQSEKQLKAIIQQYNNSLIYNKTFVR